MRWYDLPVVAFDTETTGLNPWEGDRVMEFAAVRFLLTPDGAIREDAVERTSFLINPERPIPREVTNVTNICDDDVRKAPKFAEMADQVRSILADSVTVAHNYPFDHSAIMAEFDRIGLKWPSPPAELDTLDIARRYQEEGGKMKLGHIAARLGITLEGAHRAVNDAEACGRIFFTLARRHQAPEELEGLLDWADGIGHPPETGHLVLTPDGDVVFGDPPHRGQPVEQHPSHLHWMMLSKEKSGGTWRHRYPESVRRWAERSLRVRAAGRALQRGRPLGVEDWAFDSCALE